MPSTLKKLALLAALPATLLVASEASATNYTIWIHGRNSGGTPSGFSYWARSGYNSNNNVGQAIGVNAVAADYDGTAHIATSNPTVVGVLNTYCQGQNSCYVACHSAGCSQIGYAVDKYYNSGTGKTPWNIIWVMTGGSAAGGSELAGNTAYFFTGLNIDLDLANSTMRGLYNHDHLGDYIIGYVYNNLGGDWATLTTCLFEGGCAFGGGQNDSAVSFQSSGHFRHDGTEGGDSATGSAGGTWWDYSYAWYYVDTNDTYGHCIVGSYPCEEGATGGIMGAVSPLVGYNAK